MSVQRTLAELRPKAEIQAEATDKATAAFATGQGVALEYFGGALMAELARRPVCVLVAVARRSYSEIFGTFPNTFTTHRSPRANLHRMEGRVVSSPACARVTSACAREIIEGALGKFLRWR